MMFLIERYKFKTLLLLFLLLGALVTKAQEGMVLEGLEMDSTQIELDRQIEYNQLLTGNFNKELFFDKIDLPDFDSNFEMNKRYAVNSSYLDFQKLAPLNISLGMMSPLYSPFYQNGTLLSQAAYQLSDKFTMGGFSYGTNSIFAAPNANPRTNNFNNYGSTFYMQYKVSKNFKIETRVNVTQGGGPGY